MLVMALAKERPFMSAMHHYSATATDASRDSVPITEACDA